MIKLEDRLNKESKCKIIVTTLTVFAKDGSMYPKTEKLPFTF